MSHYAKIENDRVTEVIVAEQDFINTLEGEWIQTSYRTHANQHPEGQPLRGNYAGYGYVYDRANDVFYPLQPFPSWTLNTTTWTWEPPVEVPEEQPRYMYTWDESSLAWKLIQE